MVEREDGLAWFGEGSPLVGVTICFTFFSMLIIVLAKFTCFSGKEEDCEGAEHFNEGSQPLVCGVPWCTRVMDTLCLMKMKDLPEGNYAETVKSMDVSELETEGRNLPVEVNAASLATAQYLQADSLQNLSTLDRSRLSENRHVMKAYLISKLVAPRYEVTNGNIAQQHNKTTHIGRSEFHERQTAMFHLVYNGHIKVDTRATKRQQRDAIRRLKRCARDRKNSRVEKISISEKETSGIGTESVASIDVRVKKKHEMESCSPIVRTELAMQPKPKNDSAVGSSIGKTEDHASSENQVGEMKMLRGDKFEDKSEKMQRQYRHVKRSSSQPITKRGVRINGLDVIKWPSACELQEM